MQILSISPHLLFCLVLPVLISSNVRAQDLVDLKLEIIYDPPQPWPPGTFVRSTTRVSNLSTRFATDSLIYSRSFPGNLLPSTDIFQLISGISNCPVPSFCEQFGQICFETPVIQPGEFFDCTGTTFRAVERRTRGLSRRLEVGTFKFPDPDLTNNTVNEVLRVAPFATQVPLSAFSYFFVTLLLFNVGMVAVRRS